MYVWWGDSRTVLNASLLNST